MKPYFAHKSQNVPATDRVYVGAIGQNTCTIHGRPSRLERLFHESQKLQDAKVTDVPITGFWHARHLYGEESISEILAPRSSTLNRIPAPYQRILSPRTGEVVEAESVPALFEQAIREILQHPIQWNSVQQKILRLASFYKITADCILGISGTHSTNSLSSLFEAQPGKSIEVIDVTAWSSIGANGSTENVKIAIVGMSGRFPGATDVEGLWKLLEQGRDMHKTIPKDRFNVETHYDPNGKVNNSSHTPYGCFIEEPGLFDARFFNMSPREAAQTDPMHRLALATAYEALEQSGFVLGRTASSQPDRVGTFYGQASDDWRDCNGSQEIGTYFIPGGVRAFAPGRINYYFGFRGPSYSVDTACSSSLAALQVACTSLQAGECDTAVVGGLNVLTAPDIFAGLSRGQFLSKTGGCKTWDSQADGYCRADAAGTVIVKRMEDAIADNDNVLGVILGTATNHSADAISITHPHAGNQSSLYRGVLNAAGVDPFDISYVEFHGTGTQAGDSTEIRSVTDVFAPQVNARRPDQALHISSVKANVGHSEAAAGITALIKVLLMLQKNTIPPHVGIKHEFNPALPDLNGRNVRIPFQPTPWIPKGDKPHLAFVNNFSAAGGNTALLLEGPSKHDALLSKDPRSVLPIAVSAKSISSLKRNLEAFVEYIDQNPNMSLGSLSYTSTSRRVQHSYRVAVSATDLSEVKASLSKKLEEGNFAPISSKLPKIAFVFTGQGAFYPSLGKQLYEESASFRYTINRFDTIARTQELPSIVPVIDGSAASSHFSPTVTQLTLVCVQMALVELWKSWGIQPVAVTGHSLGEYAALYAAGVLSADDTIHLVGQRATLLEARCTVGSHSMLAVKASVEDIEYAVDDMPYEVACMNAPNDTTLCGRKEDISSLASTLEEEGYKCIKLDLPYAFHSAQVEPILDEFEDIADGASFNAPEIPVISPLLGKCVREAGIFRSCYLSRHARETVCFFEAIESAIDDGDVDEKTIFLEIGPQPICSTMISNTIGSGASTLPSLHKKEVPWRTLTKSLCSLHCTGFEIDWRSFHRDFESSHELLDIPTYSFDNKNYWIDYVNDWSLHKIESRTMAPIDALAPAAPKVSKLSTTSVHRIVSESFGDGIGEVVAQSDLTDPTLRAAVLGHRINGTGFFPSTIYSDQAFTLADHAYKQLNPEGVNVGFNLGEVEVVKPLIIRESEPDAPILQITITADLNEGRARLRYATLDQNGKEATVHATATVTFEDTSEWSVNWSDMSYLIEGRMERLYERMAKNQANKISRGLAYKLFGALVTYDKKFQGMEEVILDSANFEATARVNFQTEEKDGKFFFSPFWIDSLCHISGFILNGSDIVDSKNEVYISHGWKSMRFAKQIDRNTTYNSYVKMRPAGKGVMAGDVYIFEGSEIMGVCGGLKFQCIPRRTFNIMCPPENAAPPSGLAALKPAPAVKREAAPSISQKPSTPVKTPKTPKSSPKSSKPTAASTPNVIDQAMNIIAREAELPLSELQDDCAFANLGVDSLLSLQIAGKFREDLDLDIPSSVFHDYPTPAELRGYLKKFQTSPQSTAPSTPSARSERDEDSDSTNTSVSSISSELSARLMKAQSSPPKVTVVEAPSTSPPTGSSKGAEIMGLFRSTISEQMGISSEEVTGSADLVSLGMDSLMSICILGILREQSELALPSDLFVEHPTLDDIEKFLGLNAPEPPKAPRPSASRLASAAGSRRASRRSTPKPSRRSSPTRKPSPKPSRLSAQPLPQAVSILMQGKPKTATKTLFMIPDGSGSATSYATIPAMDPSIAMYGLNCPFMTTPEDFTNGIAGVATLFLHEVRRRQPQGPYYLGGWSAGGVIAFEMAKQLLAAGERVERLVLLDSPCPIDLEPLPSRLHHFFAEVGLLGGDGPEPPKWLMPHFEATIKALSDYKPAPLTQGSNVPPTLAIWARHGVCHEPSDPRPPQQAHDPQSMKFLIDDKADLTYNGWDKLLGPTALASTSVACNHFTMMKSGEHVSFPFTLSTLESSG